MRTKTILSNNLFFVTFLGILFCGLKFLHAAEMPTLETLIDRAILREKLFDNLDANFRHDIYNPERTTPVFKESCRWVKNNEKMYIDFQDRGYLDSDKEVLRDIKLSYDGKIARSLSAHAMKGKIFRDLKKDIEKGHYYGPDIMGITLPMMSGEPVSSFLKGKPLLSPKLQKKIGRSVNIIGRDNVDGVSCIIVDVITGESPLLQELVRFYLAEDYDYCVFQAKHSFIRNGVPSLGSRIKMSKFKQIKEDLWYPMEAKYDVFQGQEKPKQTTFFKIEDISCPQEFDENLFVLEFPAGTHVFDIIVGIDYVAGGGYVQEFHIDGEEVMLEKVDLPQGTVLTKDKNTTSDTPRNDHKSNLITKVPSVDAKEPATSNETSSHDNLHRQSSSSKSFYPHKIILIVVAILVIAIVIMIKRRSA